MQILNFLLQPTSKLELCAIQELKKLKKNITYNEVLKALNRDKSDYNRKISP